MTLPTALGIFAGGMVAVATMNPLVGVAAMIVAGILFNLVAQKWDNR